MNAIVTKTALEIRPCTQKAARAFVREHHSHHNKGMACGDYFRLAAFVGGECVAVAIMGAPSGGGFAGLIAWEVTRLCCGPKAPKYTASRLLGACGRVMDAAGIQLGTSYTRIDERGSTYLATNWLPVAYVTGSSQDRGRWLPGLDERTTETIDRVRWERGPAAPTREPEARWNEIAGRWERLKASRGDGT